MQEWEPRVFVRDVERNKNQGLGHLYFREEKEFRRERLGWGEKVRPSGKKGMRITATTRKKRRKMETNLKMVDKI